MNNAVDYLDSEIQTHTRGHITIPFQPPVITLIVIVLPFSTQELIDVGFVTAASGWEYDCASAKVLGMNGRRSKRTVSLGPLELIHCPHCLQLLIQYRRRNWVIAIYFVF